MADEKIITEDEEFIEAEGLVVGIEPVELP